jgi:hypothetical protein
MESAERALLKELLTALKWRVAQRPTPEGVELVQRAELFLETTNQPENTNG